MNSFHFIDRRKNPKGKSLGNRQRFLKRAKAQIKEAVNKSLRERSMKEIDKGEKITIPSKSTADLDPFPRNTMTYIYSHKFEIYIYIYVHSLFALSMANLRAN